VGEEGTQALRFKENGVCLIKEREKDLESVGSYRGIGD